LSSTFRHSHETLILRSKNKILRTPGSQPNSDCFSPVYLYLDAGEYALDAGEFITLQYCKVKSLDKL